MRKTIFISHATPDDNDFTRWLALKLISQGYEVWCDVLFLDKGIDFWSKIEKVIRENSCKFLTVSSTVANQREGVLKELTVAAKVKKQLQDETFIIPLAIDNTLSHDDINIDIVRLNSIDFKKSWATGLKDLLEAFEKENVPKDEPDASKANSLYQKIFLHNKDVVHREEIYDSNWFTIEEFPEELRFHDFHKRILSGFDVRTLPYPAIKYKNYLCTFAYAYDFMEQLPKTESYGQSNTIRIPTTDVLSGKYDEEFISNSEASRLIVQLLNKGFDLELNRRGLRTYTMSQNVQGFWFQKDQLEKNKYEKILLVGKQKDKMWHFGVTGASKLYPFPVLTITGRVYFTQDGVNVIDSKSKQHAARRRQGKNWWNDDWRNKLLAFMKYLSQGENLFHLEVGSEEKIFISSSPVKFVGQVTYDVPDKSILESEAEIADMTYTTTDFNEEDDEELEDRQNDNDEDNEVEEIALES